MNPAVLKKIDDILAKSSKVKVKDIVKKTGFSQPYVQRFFAKLLENGKIVKVGKGRATYYVKPEALRVNLIDKYSAKLTNKNLSESDVLEDLNRNSGILKNIPNNVRSIFEYAFTEMLNNAIEHSKSRQIMIAAEKDQRILRFDITDYGMGIFNNLISKFRLKNVYEAVQELLKGKRTTLPDAHSGEGIFFTSKSSDTFIIQSSRKKLFVNNIINDVFLGSSKVKKGTKITFTISAKSKRKLKEIFDEYTDKDFNFSKTKILVKLYKYADEFLSRSQARRILTGLEKFKTVILDFKGVIQIGQAFADEIFRVYKNLNKGKSVKYINANGDIDFMIKRAIKNTE
jgi:anti-sigma regulatory factor (Ser/Thr protein kinase)